MKLMLEFILKSKNGKMKQSNNLCEKEYLSFKTNFPKMKKCKNHAICEHEGKHYCS